MKIFNGKYRYDNLFRNSRHIVVLLLVSAGLMLSCAGPEKVMKKKKKPGPVEVIKPLSAYESPITRDVAQLAAPGLKEMQEELELRLPDNSFDFVNHALRVEQVSEMEPVSDGFYVTIELRVYKGFHEKNSYVVKATDVTEMYLRDSLISLSRDWNVLLSPNFSGSHIIYHWNQQGILFYLSNEDVQSYLNAQISLQELVDSNWIEGLEDDASQGRIELNDLEDIQL